MGYVSPLSFLIIAQTASHIQKELFNMMFGSMQNPSRAPYVVGMADDHSTCTVIISHSHYIRCPTGILHTSKHHVEQLFLNMRGGLSNDQKTEWRNIPHKLGQFHRHMKLGSSCKYQFFLWLDIACDCLDDEDRNCS